MKGYTKNKISVFGLKDNPQKRFIDQFEVLLLDMGKTFMFNVDRFNVDDGLYKTYLYFGSSNISYKEVYQILLEVFHELIADGKIPENYEKNQPVSSYLKRHPFAVRFSYDELNLLEAVFAEHEEGTIPGKYIDIIKQLSETHRLGIILDIWSRSDCYYKELEHKGIGNFFEVIVFSSDYGIIEPSPKIFLKAIRALGTDVSKVAYIGDSIRRDVTVAKNVEMTSIWIKNDHYRYPKTIVKPDFIITDLQDILNGYSFINN